MKENKLHTVSVLVPCFNEEESLDNTLESLTIFIDKNKEYTFDLIFVDDGSTDKTWEILNKFNFRKIKFRNIRLSRNFGHQIAVSAGLEYASGDSVVVMDADLQDPLEVIPCMLTKRLNGYDVVYGVRRKRNGESAFKKLSAYLFYRLLNKISSTSIPKDVGDFRVISQRVVRCINAMPEHDRFLRGMVSWVGFEQTSVEYERASREAGVTKYSLPRMINLSLDGLISFSTLPLKWSSLLGFGVSSVALLGFIYVLVNRFLTSNWVDGWTTLMLAILFLGGVQLITIGILGEYVGRIYSQSKGRPLFLISDVKENAD
ncbi:glycosyltransferase [Vibrio breoganii]|uniref:glycosyltransferase family 2 protein n=1 Tax=Vibrio breoganii TaxID=553239 RepID=UPI000C83808D|nr:glycosyltransferase family 2 protein [Vibrio breoganii]PMG85449.1 glycosyltransferase [Vibrio breoganii]